MGQIGLPPEPRQYSTLLAGMQSRLKIAESVNQFALTAFGTE